MLDRVRRAGRDSVSLELLLFGPLAADRCFHFQEYRTPVLYGDDVGDAARRVFGQFIENAAFQVGSGQIVLTPKEDAPERQIFADCRLNIGLFLMPHPPTAKRCKGSLNYPIVCTMRG
jgi:hypothetical protein